MAATSIEGLVRKLHQITASALDDPANADKVQAALAELSKILDQQHHAHDRRVVRGFISRIHAAVRLAAREAS